MREKFWPKTPTCSRQSLHILANWTFSECFSALYYTVECILEGNLLKIVSICEDGEDCRLKLSPFFGAKFFLGRWGKLRLEFFPSSAVREAWRRSLKPLATIHCAVMLGRGFRALIRPPIHYTLSGGTAKIEKYCIEKSFCIISRDWIEGGGVKSLPREWWGAHCGPPGNNSSWSARSYTCPGLSKPE